MNDECDKCGEHVLDYDCLPKIKTIIPQMEDSISQEYLKFCFNHREGDNYSKDDKLECHSLKSKEKLK